MVRSMCDGNMGSLRLVVRAEDDRNDRRFGRQVSECQFHDADGVLVIASLYMDERDAPYELDMWKVDFSPLLNLPMVFSPVEYK